MKDYLPISSCPFVPFSVSNDAVLNRPYWKIALEDGSPLAHFNFSTTPDHPAQIVTSIGEFKIDVQLIESKIYLDDQLLADARFFMNTLRLDYKGTLYTAKHTQSSFTPDLQFRAKQNITQSAKYPIFRVILSKYRPYMQSIFLSDSELSDELAWCLMATVIARLSKLYYRS